MKTMIDNAYKQLACAVLNTIIDDAEKVKKHKDVIASIECDRLSLFCSIAEIQKRDFLNVVFDVLDRAEAEETLSE